MEAPPDTPQHGELFSHLTRENRERLRHILAIRVTDVYTVIRGAEAETRRDSSIGRTNLNEAFSHVAELAANAGLSPEEQASHLADIEDHLRRAVMEHPEEVLRDKLVQVQERWDEYLLEARAYREQRAMIGVPLHSELGGRTIVHRGIRQPKPSEGTVAVRIGRFDAHAGSVITIADHGPYDGRWILTEVDRDLFDKVGTLTFHSPQKALTEPKPTVTSTPSSAVRPRRRHPAAIRSTGCMRRVTP